MIALTIVAILTGILTTLVIRRTSNGTALRDARNRIQADFLEFRLFFDEPVLIWRAQINLLRDNAGLFRLLLLPALILVLPTTWLVVQLDVIYGLRPLRPGEPAVLTAQLSRAITATDRFELHGNGGISVETPPIRVYRDNQVSWRIRPARDVHGLLKLAVNGRVIGKAIATGNSPKLLSPRRSRSLASFLLHPEEPRLPDGDLEWVEIEYPELGSSWLVWFLVVSTGAALLSPRFR